MHVISLSSCWLHYRVVVPHPLVTYAFDLSRASLSFISFSQHTPAILTMGIDGIVIKVADVVTELLDRAALLWLGGEVAQHLSCRAVFDFQLIVGNLICHKKVSDVDVPRPLATRCSTILLE
jgi:hypothetical protein